VYRKTSSTLALAIAVFATASLLTPMSASACMSPLCRFFGIGCPIVNGAAAGGLVPGGTTLVTLTGRDKAVISVGHYVTPQMDVTYECSVAFPIVPGIKRIDKLTLVEDATGLPLPHYQWASSDAAIGQFQRLAEDDADMANAAEMQWQGFFSQVQGGSKGGIMHSFVFEVTLEPGTTLPKLLAALRAQGVLVNGSANPDGTLNYGHYYLRRVGDGDVHLVFPSDHPIDRAPHVRGRQ